MQNLPEAVTAEGPVPNDNRAAGRSQEQLQLSNWKLSGAIRQQSSWKLLGAKRQAAGS